MYFQSKIRLLQELQKSHDGWNYWAKTFYYYLGSILFYQFSKIIYLLAKNSKIREINYS